MHLGPQLVLGACFSSMVIMWLILGRGKIMEFNELILFVWFSVDVVIFDCITILKTNLRFSLKVLVKRWLWMMARILWIFLYNFRLLFEWYALYFEDKSKVLVKIFFSNINLWSCNILEEFCVDILFVLIKSCYLWKKIFM